MRATQKSCNLVVVAVSLLVLLGTALGDVIREPLRRPPPQPQQQAQPPAAVRHDTSFRGAPDTQLQVRAVQYDGSVNGTLRVQVKNPTKTAHKFAAQGLYFVPEGDERTAPQRLGAVGPMQIAEGTKGKPITELEIAPGATVEVALEVFCIDSHRPSPSPANRFNVGSKRLPKQMTARIEKSASEAVDTAARDGHLAPPAAATAAKPRIQSEVWKNRDADWVELDGEGPQEAGKKKK